MLTRGELRPVKNAAGLSGQGRGRSIEVHGTEGEARDAVHGQALLGHGASKIFGLRELEDGFLQILVLHAARTQRRHPADRGHHAGDEGARQAGEEALAVRQRELENAHTARRPAPQDPAHLPEGLRPVRHVPDAEGHGDLVYGRGSHPRGRRRQGALRVDAADEGQVLGISLHEPHHALQPLCLDLGDAAPQHLRARVDAQHRVGRGLGVAVELLQARAREDADVRRARGEVHHSVVALQAHAILDQGSAPKLVQAEGHPLVRRIINKCDLVKHAPRAKAAVPCRPKLRCVGGVGGRGANTGGSPDSRLWLCCSGGSLR
mmetsp:Transcript_63323/g.200025  ORF Transcript_63323/g.200025 Transcript_63323/m.200025 type:complete len:320 (-) Transcript_63323:285-1244(-)